MHHRWKWISALILAAVLGFGLWLGQRPSPPAAEPIASAAPLTPLWPASISNPAVEARKKGDHSDGIEICGAGKARLDGDDWTATANYLDGLERNSRMRWLSALRNSDDYRARAAGLFLEGIFDRDSQQKDPEAARDELVKLALGTKDPAIFALAFTKCREGSETAATPSACPQLSLDQWTREDPDNAVPWLQVAAKARREKDSAAEAAAFDRVAQAHNYEAYNWSLFAFAEPAMPADLSAADRWYLAIQTIGIEAAMPMPFNPVSQYCSREAMNDPAVHRQCAALAELLVNKATTLLDFSMGKSLGERIGWPTERVERLTQQLNASMQVIAQVTPLDPKQQWSCDSVARGNAFMSERIQLGELGFARDAIERSGETVAELSRKHLEFMEKLVRDAQRQMQNDPVAPQP
jgi:hypothetical protein